MSSTSSQIITGQTPFYELRSPVAIIGKLRSGGRPSRPPRKLAHHGLDDRLWALIELCWAQDPSARPTMAQVHEQLEKMRQLPVLNVRDLTGLITLRDADPTTIHACGAFGDIRIGILKDFGPVALKTLNIKGREQPILRHTKVLFSICW